VNAGESASTCCGRCLQGINKLHLVKWNNRFTCHHCSHVLPILAQADMLILQETAIAVLCMHLSLAAAVRIQLAAAHPSKRAEAEAADSVIPGPSTKGVQGMQSSTWAPPAFFLCQAAAGLYAGLSCSTPLQQQQQAIMQCSSHSSTSSSTDRCHGGCYSGCWHSFLTSHHIIAQHSTAHQPAQRVQQKRVLVHVCLTPSCGVAG